MTQIILNVDDKAGKIFSNFSEESNNNLPKR